MPSGRCTVSGALTAPNADATAVVLAALKHPSAGVRRNAVQVLPHDRAKSGHDALSRRPARTTPTPRSGWRPCWPWPSGRPRRRPARRSPRALLEPETRTIAGFPTPPPAAAASHDLAFLEAIAGEGARKAEPRPSTVVGRRRRALRPRRRSGSVGSTRSTSSPTPTGGWPRPSSAAWSKAGPRTSRPCSIDDAEKALAPAPAALPAGPRAALRLADRWGSKTLRTSMRPRSPGAAGHRRATSKRRRPPASTRPGSCRVPRRATPQAARASRADHARDLARACRPGSSTRSRESEAAEVGRRPGRAAAGSLTPSRPSRGLPASCSAAPDWTRRFLNGDRQGHDAGWPTSRSIRSRPSPRTPTRRIAAPGRGLLSPRRRPARRRPPEGHRRALPRRPQAGRRRARARSSSSSNAPSATPTAARGARSAPT